MRDLIEDRIRSGVIESGRGRYIESSMLMNEQNYPDKSKTWYVRYRIATCSKRELWYGAEFDYSGNLISKLFN